MFEYTLILSTLAFLCVCAVVGVDMVATHHRASY